MSTKTRRRAQVDEAGPAVDGTGFLNDEELEALYAACQNDFPEIRDPRETHHSADCPSPAQSPAANVSVKTPQPLTQAAVVQGAATLKEQTGASYLYGSMTPLFGAQVDANSYRLYLDEVLKQAGASTDPLERMMVEQLTLAHHNIGRLHVKAASSRSVQEAAAYNGAAARLMSEYRRTALALKTYRAPTPQSHLTVMRVQQQNVAVGDQQVALVEGGRTKEALPRAIESTRKQEGAKALVNHVNGETARS